VTDRTIARARLAALVRHGADPEHIVQARTELRALGLKEKIHEAVSTWPPFSDAELKDIAAELFPGG
jgi:hypothetical protein